ncbi:DUF5134 domain-containing protein [Pseudonocardia acidicola]|uniref:DUF5134 domain-containing protein n=1 Tax=Pseudonocardia acidicola TaxID=2724939 RepID=A0ABX1S7L8_9PSEU|nr:DUF5134 domain-containing protein [Pseudonocardia acidicola]NMH97550.1 DUF5134 domain-containing protein [Pseudonocardia acidicola]
MASTWLPSWLGYSWTAVFAVILIVHVWHAAVLAGRHRLWHGVHVLMAAGMIVMFLPTARMVVPAGFGAMVFGLAAVVVAGLRLGARVRGETVGGLWLATVVDLAAMAYMFTLASFRVLWLTIALAAWLIVEAAGWASGRLYTVLEQGGLGGARTAPVPASVPSDAASGSAGPGLPGAAARPRPAVVVHGTVHATWIRVTLALMALGMAYMLLAMQFGMGAMAGMPGM